MKKLLVLVVLTVPNVALASPCDVSTDAFLAIEPGAEVPSNIKAIHFRPFVGVQTLVELTTRDGRVVPTQVADRWVHLQEELVAGEAYTLTLTRKNRCIDSQCTKLARQFVAGEPVAAPDTLGDLMLKHFSVFDLPRAGVCAPVEGDAVEIELLDREAVQAWLPSLAFEVVVDGVPTSRNTNGLVRSLDGLSAVAYRACGEGTGLAEGEHSIRVRAQVAGSERYIDTKAVPFTLLCGAVGSDGSDWTVGPDHVGGGYDLGPNSRPMTTGRADGGVGAFDMPPVVNGVAGGGGCHAAAMRSAGGMTWLVLLGLFLMRRRG